VAILLVKQFVPETNIFHHSDDLNKNNMEVIYNEKTQIGKQFFDKNISTQYFNKGDDVSI
jgi:hypothetical protein